MDKIGWATERAAPRSEDPTTDAADRISEATANVVFDERHISNIHIAGEGGANSPVAVRRFVGKNLRRWLKVERFRKDRLVTCVRRLDVGDDLRCVGEKRMAPTLGKSRGLCRWLCSGGQAQK